MGWGWEDDEGLMEDQDVLNQEQSLTYRGVDTTGVP